MFQFDLHSILRCACPTLLISTDVVNELPQLQLKHCKLVILLDCMTNAIVLYLRSPSLDVVLRRRFVPYQGDQSIRFLDKILLLRAQLNIKCPVVLLCTCS